MCFDQNSPEQGASLAANMLQMGQIYGSTSSASSNHPPPQNFYDSNSIPPGPPGQTRKGINNGSSTV